MAFLSARQEQLVGLGRRFVQAWGAGDKEAVSGLVSSDAVFKGDGVLYTHDTKGRAAILDALAREHAAYEHQSYAPVAVAASEDDAGVVFVGVAWTYKNVGPLPGVEQASGRTSRGFSIKELHFGRDDTLTLSRVTRQMTADEQDALLQPGVRCQPADVYADILPQLGHTVQEAAAQAVDEGELSAKMSANLKTWVGCWSSDADLGQLDAVLDPAMKAFDGYGLHHAADKPDREGHAISLMGASDAKASIQELHRKFTDRNTLLASAIAADVRVGFDHWRGEAQGRDSDARFVAEGVDMLLFDEAGRISCLLQFDTHDYSRMLRGG